MNASYLEFGGFRLHPQRRLLEKGGVPVELNARTMDILLLLLSRTGEVVSKEELLAHVWPTTIVDEGSIRVHMTYLRRALGQQKSEDRPLRNVSGKGYSFVSPVTAVSGEGGLAWQPPSKAQLPSVIGDMFGRETFDATVAEDFRSVRFVTIYGPGGVGKTATALTIASRIDNKYRDGAFFVDLAQAGGPVDVETMLASRFGSEPDDPIQKALDRISKMNVLLILDNCEHVLSAATSMAQRILTFSPDVHVLVTSRRPTGAACERARRLDPLPTPLTERISAREVTRSPAVEMFVSRANATGMRFSVSDANAAIVAELVRQLDGLPLAIELAAARMEESGVEGVLALVEEDRLGHLTNGRRTALSRHRSLASLLEWSYSLLSPAEASAFRKLGIMDGSFTAAEAGLAAGHGDDLVAADLLRGLYLASLIEASSETCRYVMSNIAREFAMMKLEESGELPVSLARRSRQKAPQGSMNPHFAMDTRVWGGQ